MAKFDIFETMIKIKTVNELTKLRKLKEKEDKRQEEERRKNKPFPWLS